MHRAIPGIFPPKVSDDAYRKNPLGAEPFPYPGGMPSPVWSATPHRLLWEVAGLPAGVFAQAKWASPIFDLRPEYRNAGMPGGSGQGYLVGQAPSLGTNRGPVAVTTGLKNTGAVPIWRPSGAGGKLWVQTTNLTSGPVVGQTGFGFEVTAEEFAHVNDPSDLPQIAPVEDITSDFVGRIPSALSIFVPPGGGYPVRYYRCILTFTYRADITAALNWQNGDGNPITIVAAYY